ncbi:hypothetical protein [Peptoniphilus sp. HCN-40583]|uniref:hypothetical protein n=1 Tax=Peptoniphilus sp. HCN-40583 TaxID=3134662 RepID=UPI0030BE57B6
MEKLQLQSPLRKIIDAINSVIERSNNDADLLRSFRNEPEKVDITLPTKNLNGELLEIKTSGQYKVRYVTESGSVSVYLNDVKGVNGLRCDLNKKNSSADLLLMSGDVLCFKTKDTLPGETVNITLVKNLIGYIYGNAEDLNKVNVVAATLKNGLSKIDDYARNVKDVELQNNDLSENLADLRRITRTKVDKVVGKRLSTYDFDDAFRDQLRNLSVISSDVDGNGIYRTVEYRDKDENLVFKTQLIGSAPRYSQVKLNYYKKNTLVNSQTWGLTYDVNDFAYRKEMQK